MFLQKDIINKEILTNTGNIVGYVKDIEIDASSKKIIGLVISKESKSSGFFSLNNEEESEMIPIEEVGSIGDKIILKESMNDILNDIQKE